ncbi:MAG: Hsp20/alpha crystallin family protein [Pseudomonadota bacterium]
MDYIEIRFGEDLEKPSSRDKSLSDMFQSINPMFCLSQRVWKPQMDIFETRTTIIIQAEIAGVEKDDITIEVSNKAVRVSGNRSRTPPEETATYRLAEIQFGRFERILYLPSLIDTQKVSASYSNGFLEIVLAKFPLDRTKRIELSYK